MVVLTYTTRLILSGLMANAGEEIPCHVDDTSPLGALALTAVAFPGVEIFDLHTFKADIFTCVEMLAFH